MTPAARRARDADATRAAILDAAERIFVDRGFADASTSQISREAGVTKSLIHHHFGSKEKLWQEVKNRRFDEYGGVQKRLLEESEASADLLRDALVSYFGFLRRNPDFCRLVSWSQLEDGEADDRDGEGATGSDETLMELGVQKVAEAQARGELRDDIDPFHVMVTFVGLAHHWFQCKEHMCRPLEDADGEVRRDDEAYLEAATRIFFEGLLPRAAEDGGA